MLFMKEYLEIWDWEKGKPTGLSIERNEAHEKGIAHEGVHLWICRKSYTGNEILFQHRSPEKLNYPDCLDISVAGHVPFDVKENKIHKEAEEELGISPSNDDLCDLGFFRYEEDEEKFYHREFQHIYVLRDDRPLSHYSFVDGEVTGLFSVPLDFLKKLYHEDDSMTCQGYDGSLEIQRTLSKKDFHPLLFAPVMSVYMKIVLAAVEELLSKGTVSIQMPHI